MVEHQNEVFVRFSIGPDRDQIGTGMVLDRDRDRYLGGGEFCLPRKEGTDLPRSTS